jgi:hypothetical protein
MNLKKLASAAVAALFLLTPVTAAHADAVPTAPTNVVATPGPLYIELTFDAPNALTEGVTEFDAYVSLDKGKTWKQGASVMTNFDDMTTPDDLIGLTETIYAGYNLQLKALSTYKVKVVAVNASGPSADSSILTAKLPASAPIFGTFSVHANDKQKFNKGLAVTWSVFSNGGKPITSYTVKYRKYSADGTGAWTIFKKVSANTTKITIPYSKLKAWTDFEVAVDGTNSIGTGGGGAEIKVDAKGNISVWV